MNRWLTVAEVAEEERVTARTVLRWIDGGKLRARRQPGGRLRISQVDYAAMQAAGATAAERRILAAVIDQEGE